MSKSNSKSKDSNMNSIEKTDSVTTVAVQEHPKDVWIEEPSFNEVDGKKFKLLHCVSGPNIGKYKNGHEITEKKVDN